MGDKFICKKIRHARSPGWPLCLVTATTADISARYMSDMISGHKYQLAHASDLHLITTLFHRKTFLMVDGSLLARPIRDDDSRNYRERGREPIRRRRGHFSGENCRSLSRGAHVRIGGFYICEFHKCYRAIQPLPTTLVVSCQLLHYLSLSS